MRNLLNDTKKHVYRATSVIFLFQLFGALGAGFFFTVSNILKVDILTPGSALSETLWHIFFWATDFFFIAFVALLAYYIAGLPALAPALTLSVYFSHFAGQYTGGFFNTPMYNNYFATPADGGGGVNIGYMGYLIMALLLAYLIKWLFAVWDKIKLSLGKKLDKPLASLGKKIKPLENLGGVALLEALDLIVLVLILPVVAAIVTYFAINYLIAVPFNALGEALEPIVINCYESSNALGGLLTGALVGFDITGPLSTAAFRAAASFTQTGGTVPMTVYGLCFAAVGWVPLAAFLINKLFKKGGKMDADDTNLAMSGPINAIFDNMKLTVNFSMTFAMRDPVRVILSYIVSASITGALAGLFSLGNKLYAEAEYVEKFMSGEIYTSFLQPLYSISNTGRGILLLVCSAIGVIIGAFLMIALKEAAEKRRRKNNIVFEPDGDIVLTVRRISEKYNKKRIVTSEEYNIETENVNANSKS